MSPDQSKSTSCHAKMCAAYLYISLVAAMLAALLHQQAMDGGSAYAVIPTGAAFDYALARGCGLLAIICIVWGLSHYVRSFIQPKKG